MIQLIPVLLRAVGTMIAKHPLTALSVLKEGWSLIRSWLDSKKPKKAEDDACEKKSKQESADRNNH